MSSLSFLLFFYCHSESVCSTDIYYHGEYVHSPAHADIFNAMLLDVHWLTEQKKQQPSTLFRESQCLR